jgi:uncharacterized iron-regulated membrane protein
MPGPPPTLNAARTSLWEAWLNHPQRLWLRKALVQVHLWSGIGLSLYVLLMSVSGTILIYRVDISRASLRPRLIAAGPGPRLTTEALKQSVQRAYPAYQVEEVAEPKQPNRPVQIALERDGVTLQRLFNPFTGADIGNAVPPGFRFIEWLADLHDNLLYESAGGVVNGIGGAATTLLCITGAVIWWPGVDKWRRALTVSWKAEAKGLNWGLHRAIGIWSVAFIIFWGISGIYLAVPEPFEAAVAFLDPPAKFPTTFPSNVPAKSATKFRGTPSFGEQALSWLARLHFGRFGGLPTKLIWTLFGLAPIALVVTGIWMWWNRVLRPKLRRKARRANPPPLARGSASILAAREN